MSKVVCYSLLVVLLIGFINAQSQVGDECVVTEPLREGLYAVHPTDCAQYLQCVHGSFAARSCPRGLHWSTFHVACNWPQLANCANAAARVDLPVQGLDV